MPLELPATTKDITVEWLNEVLHENGFLGDSNIVSLQHEAIGVGKGFLSDMSRLHLSYDKDTTQLPKTIIAKLPTEYPSHRQVAMLYNVYEKEIQFYTDIAPKSPIRVPELVYGAMQPENEKFVLLMEDCAKYQEADPDLKGLSEEQTKIIAEKIAAFHARWWDDEYLSSLSWLSRLQTTEGVDDDVNTYRNYWDTCAQSKDFRDALPYGGLDAGTKIYELRPWCMNNSPQDKLTFLHLDFKADNMFFDWNDPENPLIIFDWSLTFIGRGVFDLSMLLGWSLDTDIRRNIEKDIIKLYHESLLKQDVKGYSFDECWLDYLKGLVQLSRFPISFFFQSR